MENGVWRFSTIAHPHPYYYLCPPLFHLISSSPSHLAFSLPPQFFASMTTTFFLNLLLSTIKGHPGDLTYSGIINFGHFPTESEHSYQWFELPIFVLMGAIGEPCIRCVPAAPCAHSGLGWGGGRYT